jgi:hypothetical protein
MQIGTFSGMEQINDYILVRRPAVPRWWDPVSRPHVAILSRYSHAGEEFRYYLSKVGRKSSAGKNELDVAEIDNLPENTVVEIRLDATRANLYVLEMVEGLPCWRWIGKCRGLSDFNSDRVDWEHLERDAFPPCPNYLSLAK